MHEEQANCKLTVKDPNYLHQDKEHIFNQRK